MDISFVEPSVALFDRTKRGDSQWVYGMDAGSCLFLAGEWRKDLTDGREQGWLIRLNDEQIIATGLNHLGTEGLLAVQGIVRQHATLPVNLSQGLRSNGQFAIVLLRI